MYVPRHFAGSDPDRMRQLVRAHPLGVLVTLTPDGLDANHIPFLLHDDPAPHGELHGHIARANPLWRDHYGDLQALVIFRGPEHYVSPSWYASKKESAKVVPTWNYAVVHAHGRLRIVEDPVWIRAHLEEMTGRQEAKRRDPWALTDAPADYIEKMMSAIVGLEIRLTHLVGKFKLSQNRTDRDRDGVVDGLLQEGTESAKEMARLVREAGKLPPT
ncbi:MAG: transcriptional regulator [Betaproteobacteria bacterium RIFCSPLOWO2_12_FULL_63_13]|nr:MAG: transcriptional regulator [Betaproteobacteria bacterium RIFCSPLOWO2_12_FULL_63_13]